MVRRRAAHYLCTEIPYVMKQPENTHAHPDEGGPLFWPGMKLADLIESNYELLAILSRLSIPLGFGETSVGEMCRRHDLSPELFLLICRIYSSQAPARPCESLSTADLPHIMNYLHASHVYYLQTVLPRLDARMEAMIGACEGVQRKILHGFFADYRREVDNHFAYEERTVFPYVRSLLEGGTPPDGYSILCFEDNHSDIDGKLSDLKSIVVKYLPESCPAELRHEVLFEIFRFEEDLRKHTEIENTILIPLVEQLEKDGKRTDL